eukprot:1452215-Prymnesium_polylepis.1
MRNVNRAPRREPGRSDPLSHAPPTANQQHAKGMAPKHPGDAHPADPRAHTRPAPLLIRFTVKVITDRRIRKRAERQIGMWQASHGCHWQPVPS